MPFQNLTPEQSNFIIQSRGLDPSTYMISDDGMVIPKSAGSPTLASPSIIPNKPTDLPNPTTQNYNPFQTAAMSFGQAAPSSIGAGLGGAGGLALGGATVAALGLAPETMGASLIPLALMLAGGIGGSALAKKGQQAIEPDKWTQAVQEASAENPKSALLGSLASIPLSGMSPSPTGVLRGVGGLAKLATGLEATAPEINAVRNLAFGTGIGAAQPTLDYLTGQGPAPTLGGTLQNAAIGALFNKPNTIGNALGFGALEVPDELSGINRNLLQQSGQQAVPIQSVPPLSLEQLQAAGGMPMTRQEILSGSLRNVAQRSNKMANYKGTPEAPDIATLEGEGGPIPKAQSDLEEAQNQFNIRALEYQKARTEMLNDQLKRATDQLRNIQQPVPTQTTDLSGLSIGSQVNRPETLPANAISHYVATEEGNKPASLGLTDKNLPTAENEPNDLEQRKQEGFLDRYQTSSEVKEKLSNEGIPVSNIKGWNDAITKWAEPRFNVKISEDGSITNAQTGQPVAGAAYLRNALREAFIKINPDKAGIDTLPHELHHVFMDYLEKYGTNADRKLINKAYSSVESSPEFLGDNPNFKPESDPQHLLANEFLAKHGGLEFVNRQLNLDNEGEGTRWIKDFTSHLKTKFTKTASLDDYTRLLNYKLGYQNIRNTPNLAGATGSNIERTQEASEMDKNLPELIPGERLVVVQRPDGSVYHASFGDKYWEIPGQERRESIGLPTENGWSHTILPKGDRILQGRELNNIPRMQGESNLNEDKFPEDRYYHLNDSTGVGGLQQYVNSYVPTYHLTKPSDLPKIKSYIESHWPQEMTGGKIEMETNPAELFNHNLGKIYSKDGELLGKIKHSQISNDITFSSFNPKMDEVMRRHLVNPDYYKKSPSEMAKYDYTFKPEDAGAEVKKINPAVRNQESSELVHPQDKKIKNLLDNMVVQSQAPKPDMINLEEGADALRDQVDWSKSPVIKQALSDKEFDHLDPEHWKTIQQLYNNHYPAVTAVKPAETPNIAKEPKQTAQNRTNKGLIVKPKNIPPADTLKPVSEMVGHTPEKTPEQRERQLFDAKNRWLEVEHTENPYKTMDMLADRWRHNTDVNRRQELAAQMQYIKDKYNVQMPELEGLHTRHQDESELGLSRKGEGRTPYPFTLKELNKGEANQPDIDLNNLKWQYTKEGSTQKIPQVERELGQFETPERNQDKSDLIRYAEQSNQPEIKQQEQRNDNYRQIALTKPQLDKAVDMATKAGAPKEAQDFDKGIRQLYPLKDQTQAKYMAPILKASKGVSQEGINKVENVLLKEFRDKTDHSSELSGKELQLYKTIRNSYNQKQQDQIAANQPVTDYKANGEEFKRLPEIDPFYHVNKISPVVADKLTEGTLQEREALKKDFLDWQEKNGIDKQSAQAKLDSILNAYDTGKPNMTRFAADRKAEGIGLPDSWMRKGRLLENLNGYYSRVASDRAWHDIVEKNPDLATSLNLKTDPWNKPYESDAKDISGIPAVRDIMDKFVGESFHKDEAKIKIANRIAAAMMLGPLTNIHIAAGSFANSIQYIHPTELPGALSNAVKNLASNWEKVYETGYHKKDFTSVKDLVDTNLTGLEKLNSLASSISNMSGREPFNHFTKSLLQGIGEYVIKNRAIEANQGNREAINLMKQVDTNWSQGKTYTGKDLDNIASVFSSYIHGAHDARTLPGWMLKDTIVQPFFSLASWNIAQTNAWMKHVWTPATKGNFTPIIMSTLGSVLGGYVVKQMREGISDKKAPFPSLTELVNSDRGLEGNIPLAAYNLMAMSSYTGFAGILSVAAKAGQDLMYKNIPQGAAFPLDELISNPAHRVSQFLSAMYNDPTFDYTKAVPKLVTDMVRENFQLGRVIENWTADKTDILGENAHYEKNVNDALGDLRRFKMAEGMPYDEQTPSESNPYMERTLKEFKRTQNLQEAAQDLPELIQGAFTRANGNIEVLKEQLNKIKQNTYETMPSPEQVPMSFYRYLNFLRNTQGEEAAGQRLSNYFTQEVMNKAKGSMVPSL